MAPKHSLPGRKAVVRLINTLRFLIALYLAVLSITAIIISGIFMNVGGIIASIYLIPTTFVLLALELGHLRSHAGVIGRMQTLRIVGLQFSSAMMAGISWYTIEFFIPCCVAFGMSIGIMNLVAIYYILWGRHAQEDGLYASTEDGDKSPKSDYRCAFNARDGEGDALLLIRNGSETDIESARTSQSSLSYDGPKIVNVD